MLKSKQDCLAKQRFENNKAGIKTTWIEFQNSMDTMLPTSRVATLLSGSMYIKIFLLHTNQCFIWSLLNANVCRVSTDFDSLNFDTLTKTLLLPPWPKVENI